MAGNHTSVYAPSQASGFNIAETIGQQERLSLARKDQQMREQQLEEHRRDKQLARDEKLRERLMKTIQNYDTGSASLNELQGRMIMQAVNRKGEIYNQLRKGNLSDSERIKLEMENMNLDNLPSNLKVATQNFTKMNQDYMEGVKSGSLFRNLDFEKKVLNGFENYLGGIDENGFPLVGFKDIDGDGKMDLMPWDNLKDGIGVWEFQPKMDYDKMITEMSKGLGTVKTKDREGYDIITEKGIPLDVAQSSAQSMMYDSNGYLTNFAKSRLTELGYDHRNPKEETLKGIERDVAERILNSKDRESLRERDTTSEQGALNRSQRERHHQDNKTKETKINTISYVDNISGATYPFKDTDTFSFNKPFDLNDTKLGKLHKNGYLSSITIEDDKITLHGEEVKSQSKRTIDTGKGEETISENNWGPISITSKTSVQNILGDILGTNSYEESIKKIKEIKNNNSPNQNMSTSKSTSSNDLDWSSL